MRPGTINADGTSEEYEQPGSSGRITTSCLAEPELRRDGSVPLGPAVRSTTSLVSAGRSAGRVSGVYERMIAVLAGHRVVTETSVNAGNRRIVSDATTEGKSCLNCGNTALLVTCGQ